MKHKLLAVFGAIIILSGCASAVKVASRYPEGKFLPTDPSSLTILTKTPERKFITIGEVTLRGVSDPLFAREERKLREEVSKIGGDAVILAFSEKCEERLAPAGISRSCEVNAEGKVIKFQD